MMISQHIKPQVAKGNKGPFRRLNSVSATAADSASVINIIQHSIQPRAKDEMKNTQFKNSRAIYQTISKLAKARS